MMTLPRADRNPPHAGPADPVRATTYSSHEPTASGSDDQPMSIEDRTDVEAARRAWRRAPLAAIAWLAPDGIPDVASVLPLTRSGRPVLALPYAQIGLARALAASTEVVLAIDSPSEAAPGASGPAASLVTVRGQAEVTADPEGERFQNTGLIEVELAKYPTSRRRLDSLLLRREHWWFLPRLLVQIDGLHRPRTVPPGDGLLVTGGRTLQVDPCHIEDREPLRIRATGPGADRRPAAVIEYGGDLPELERPWERRWHGTLEADRFETDRVTGEGPSDRPLGLRQRLRAEKHLERACKAGLREAGHA
jgi:hypothetical protein